MTFEGWNWFFSTLAQSIASLVGIIVAISLTVWAFLNEELTSRINRAHVFLDEAKTLQKKIARIMIEDHVLSLRKEVLHFIRYLSMLEEERNQLESCIREPDNKCLKRYGFSRYDNPLEIRDRIRQLLEDMHKEPPKIEHLTQLSPYMGQLGVMDGIDRWTRESRQNVHVLYRWEQENVDPLYYRAQELTYQIRQFLSTTERSYETYNRRVLIIRNILSWAGILLVVGTGLSLWLLPITTDTTNLGDQLLSPLRCLNTHPLCSWKVLLLLLFGGVGLWVFRLFLWETLSLVQKHHVFRDLEEFTSVESFCPLFKNPEQW